MFQIFSSMLLGKSVFGLQDKNFSFKYKNDPICGIIHHSFK